ncbi:MAG: C10 family peptidase [Bacteroidales bacterium]|nr:C10 family peptidase [Bacteroidales bacterium]
MKSRFYSIILGICIVTLLPMCTDSLNINRKPNKHSNYVAISEAEKNVIELLNIIDDGKTKANGGQRSIIEKFSIGSITKSSDNPVYHVFNFSDNRGYAIASADRRTIPVFCIIDEGNLSNLYDNPALQSVFTYMDLYYRIKTGAKVYDLNGVEIDPQTVKTVYGYMLNDEGEDEEEEDTIECFYTNNPYVEYQAWQVKERTGNIIPTKWGQGAPYNKYCKTPNGNNALVGCVAIAIGQIMAYHKYDIVYNGHYYDWDIMEKIEDISSYPEDTVAWNRIAHLLADLGRPENLDMHYGVSTSWAYYDSLYNTFAHFGYQHTGTRQIYSSTVPLGEYLEHGPIFFCGAKAGENIGHAWVIDEEVTRRRRVRYNYQQENYTEVYQEDKVLHMNLGWNGNANGYYHPGVFDVGLGPINFRTDSTSGTYSYQYVDYLKFYYDIY